MDFTRDERRRPSGRCTSDDGTSVTVRDRSPGLPDFDALIVSADLLDAAREASSPAVSVMAPAP